MNTSQSIKKFLLYCQNETNLNPKTIKAYTCDLLQFLEFIQKENVTKDVLHQYITNLYAKYKNKTIKRKIATLKTFYAHICYENPNEINMMEKVKLKFIEEKKLPKIIPENIIVKILNNAYAHKKKAQSIYQKETAIRNVAILELLFATGMRVSEISNLKKHSIDLDNHVVRIDGKGNKERVLQIENEQVLKILKEYCEISGNKVNRIDYFFINKRANKLSEQSIRNMINKHVTELNLSIKITPHMFRHSFATFLLNEGVDIRYIQQMLGHSSITTTQIYTYVTSAKQKKILLENHPRNKMQVNAG